jgi:hypothetical protein
MARKKKVIEADVTGTTTGDRTVRPIREGVMATWDIGDRTGRIALLRSRAYAVKSECDETLVVRCPLSGHLFTVDAALVEDV